MFKTGDRAKLVKDSVNFKRNDIVEIVAYLMHDDTTLHEVKQGSKSEILTSEYLEHFASTGKDKLVHHPNHYNQGSIEALEVIYDWNLNFALGSAIKYISRADYKGDALRDLEKAKEYLELEIAQRKKSK